MRGRTAFLLGGGVCARYCGGESRRHQVDNSRAAFVFAFVPVVTARHASDVHAAR